MKIIKKIFFKIPLSLRIYLREHKGIFHFKEWYSLNKVLREQIKKYKKLEGYKLTVRDDIDVWIRAFKKFIIAQPSEVEVAIEFFKDNIYSVKKNTESDDTDAILICIVKNDLLKVKTLIKHHRTIGIKKFAFLDNGSSDGTKEWLLEQNDVDLFEVEDKYTTNRREAWVNKIIAYYGLKRWYLIVDSDELFVYSDFENKSITDVISYCEGKNIKRVRALMVDMYGDNEFYSSENDIEYLKEMKYFDTSTYESEHRDVLDLIIGGPRKRIFGESTWLTKYPLCYFDEGDIEGKSHFLFPYKKNMNSECLAALLHYKFLPRDIKKYRQIAENGSYFNGSIHYKKYVKYIDSNSKMNFMCECSKEYTNSKDLSSIPNIKTIDF